MRLRWNELRVLTVGIGADAAFHGCRAIHRYVVHLVRELVNLPGEEQYRLFAFRARSGPFPPLPREARPRLTYCWTRLPGRVLLPLWSRLGWPSLERFTGPVEVYHATDFTLPPLRQGRIVFTLHGVSYLVRPDLLPLRVVNASLRDLRRAVDRACLFIAVSDTTRRQFEERFPEVRGRVRVVPLGVSPQFSSGPTDAGLLDRLGVRRPYVLYVGALSRVKNVPLLLEAFRRLRARQPAVELVLAGPSPPPEEGRLARLLAQSDARILGVLPPGGEELPALYRGASAFCYLSLSEGWASPPLEAMACGAPVVASRASSLPESLGNAALLVSPEDPEEVAQALDRVLSDPDLARDLAARGREQAARFTWEHTARLTLEIYREAAAH